MTECLKFVSFIDLLWYEVDIIALTETWNTGNGVLGNLFDGYDYCENPSNTRAGVIVVYINKQVKWTKIEQMNNGVGFDINGILITHERCQDEDIILVVVYRHVDADKLRL